MSATLGDVSVEADAGRMVEDVLRRYGRLDILVNNAGAPQGADRDEIEDVPVAASDLVMGGQRSRVPSSWRARQCRRCAGRAGAALQRLVKAAFRPGPVARDMRPRRRRSSASPIARTRSGTVRHHGECGAARADPHIARDQRQPREFGDDLKVGFQGARQGHPRGSSAVRRGGIDDRLLASDGAAFVTGQAIASTAAGDAACGRFSSSRAQQRRHTGSHPNLAWLRERRTCPQLRYLSPANDIGMGPCSVMCVTLPRIRMSAVRVVRIHDRQVQTSPSSCSLLDRHFALFTRMTPLV